MKNSVLNYGTIAVNGEGMLDRYRTGSLGIPLYDHFKLVRVKAVLQSLDASKYFGILSLANNICLEKISWQIYKSSNYWDILLLLNDIDPLFGMPYDYDIVSESTDAAITKYESRIYGRLLSSKDKQRLHDAIAAQDSEKNEEHRKIYYIYPERIYEVRQLLYEIGAIDES